MNFLDYMMNQFSGIGGNMMVCFIFGMFLVIPGSLVTISVGTKIGTFVGEGLGSILRSVFRL